LKQTEEALQLEVTKSKTLESQLEVITLRTEAAEKSFKAELASKDANILALENKIAQLDGLLKAANESWEGKYTLLQQSSEEKLNETIVSRSEKFDELNTKHELLHSKTVRYEKKLEEMGIDSDTLLPFGQTQEEAEASRKTKGSCYGERRAAPPKTCC